MAVATRYIRTSAGTAAALNPLSLLPRPLKQLLVAISGQFEPFAYAARTQGLVDVKSMLETLESYGFVRPVSASSNPVAGDSGFRDAAMSTVPDNLGFGELSDRIALMSDFVAANLPEDAIELILEFEALNDESDLSAFLRHYEPRIRHLGPPAAAHLAALTRATRRRSVF